MLVIKDVIFLDKLESVDFFKDFIKRAAVDSVESFSKTFLAESNDAFYFDLEHYSNADDTFTKFISGVYESIIDDAPCKCLYICGEAGIGKSTFLNQLINYPNSFYLLIDSTLGKTTKQQTSFTIDKKSSVVIDFNVENTEQNPKYDFVDFLSQIVLKSMHIKLQHPELLRVLEQAEESARKDNKTVSGYLRENEENQISSLADTLCKFCNLLKSEFGLDFLLVFDNIDLCSAEFQRKAVIFFAELNKAVTDLLSIRTETFKVRFVLTARSDTFAHWKKFSLLSNYLTESAKVFPKPIVFKIVKKIYENSVNTKANVLYMNNPNPLNVKMWQQDEQIEINSKERLINYIVNTVFGLPEQVWFDYMDTDFHNFHNYFVNYNVRRFGLFILHSIGSGAYSPIEFQENRAYFRKFDYLKVLLTGSKSSSDEYVKDGILQYNVLVKPEEGTNGFPIFFNLFETYMLTQVNDIYYEDVFTIYIRILQFLWWSKTQKEADNYENKDSINVSTIITALSPFYNKQSLEKALKMLIFAGVLVETRFASRNYCESAEQIVLIDPDSGDYAEIDFQVSGAESLCAGALYLKHIITEYEYISFCSNYYVTNPNSALRNPVYNRGNIDYIARADESLGLNEFEIRMISYCCKDEYNVIRFISAMQIILWDNFNKYKTSNRLKDFKEIFHQEKYGNPKDTESIHLPWRRISTKILETLYSKKNYAGVQAKTKDNARESTLRFVQREKYLGLIIDRYSDFFKVSEEELDNLLSDNNELIKRDVLVDILNMFKEGKNINDISTILELTKDDIINHIRGGFSAQ